jgi:hypothetical protein
MKKIKPSELFEGENSSLRKTFEIAVGTLGVEYREIKTTTTPHHPNMKSYIEGLRHRIALVRKAYGEDAQRETPGDVAFHTHNLIDYLSGLDYFVEEEKKGKMFLFDEGFTKDKWKFCPVCGRPLYVLKDGSLTCVEMHH